MSESLAAARWDDEALERMAAIMDDEALGACSLVDPRVMKMEALALPATKESPVSVDT